MATAQKLGMRSKTSEKGIYKEENGTYTVDTSFKKKRISRRGFKKLREAKTFKLDQMSLFNSDKYRESKPIRFEQLVAMFKERHFTKIRESTAQRYLIDLDGRISPYFQYMKVSDISTSLVEKFQSDLVKNSVLSPKSINNCLRVLHTLLGKAEFWGIIEKNPHKVESLPVRRNGSENWWDERIFITNFVEELKRRPEDRHRAALLLGLECGLRLGEVIGLNKKDVNLELGYISINKSWDDKNHKAGPTKSGKSRTIKFDRNSLLNEWLEELLLSAESASSPLFTTRTGRRLIGRKLSNEVFKKYKEKLGLPEITFHGLRHTFASWYMIRGGSIWDLYKIMGHSDFKTTVKLYAHHSKDAAVVPTW